MSNTRRHILAGTIGSNPALVTPSQFTHFWRADELGLADDAAVNTWAANTGEVSLLQAGAPAPTYKASAASAGLPSVLFTPTDYMDAAVGTLSQPVTYVFYVDMVAAVATVALSDGTGGATRHNFFINTGNVYSLYAGAVANVPANPTPNTGDAMLCAVFATTSSLVRENGVESSALNPSTQDLNAFRLGANVSGGFGANFYAYAVGIVDGATTQADRDEFQAFGVLNGWNA